MAQSPMAHLPGTPEPVEWDRDLALLTEMNTMLSMHTTVACETHPGCGAPCFCCDHCLKQDEHHPNGIVHVPLAGDMFMCRTCVKLYENRQRLISAIVKIQCKNCLFDEVLRIKAIDPGLYRELKKGS